VPHIGRIYQITVRRSTTVRRGRLFLCEIDLSIKMTGWEHDNGMLVVFESTDPI
jgi:hypothetical protein